MSASVVCFASAKGGSGKTVTSASLGKFLAALGKRVLVADCDASTNGLTLLFLDQVVAEKARRAEDPNKGEAHGIFEIFEQGDGVVDIVPLSQGMDLIPATFVLRQTEGTPEAAVSAALTDALIVYRASYDFIFLDAQAGSDTYALLAAEASDQVVIVSEYDPISAEGVERLKFVFGPTLAPGRTWVLFNKVLPELAPSIGEFLSVTKYLTPIPWDADVIRAFTRRQLAIDTENGNAYTLAIIEIGRTLFDPVVTDEIDAWTHTKEKELRAPIVSRAEEVERELLSIEGAIAETSSRLRQVERSALLVYALPPVYVAFVFLLISLRGSDLLADPIVALSLIIAALVGIVGVVPTRRRTTERQALISAQARTLERRWEELREESRKYRTLSELGVRDILTRYPSGR